MSDGGDYRNYVNVPQTIGVVVSSKMATLHELDTVLGLRDLHDLLEIQSIDAHNTRIASQARE